GAPLVPGSYMLHVRAPGRTDVDQAIAIGRGEHTTLAIPIPPAGAVPDGFVYIPAGRTPYGSADDESMRAFFHAVPMHTVETGAFLTARHETTYGEWVQFLDALPDDERARHTPNTAEAGAEEGGSVLRRVATGRWELHIGSARAELTEDLPYPAP